LAFVWESRLHQAVLAAVRAVLVGLAAGMLAALILACLVALAFWVSSLAPLNRRSENLLVTPVIVAELKFSNVQVKIPFADLVEGADTSALDQRPEALDCVCMNRTNNIEYSTVAQSPPPE
jgi:hypothetical protein